MKKLYLALFAMLLALSSWAQNASVQIIHNSPTPGTDAGPVVDIYVNGALLPELTGVPFRAATPFLDVPASADIEVAIAVNPSTSVDDAIATFPLGQLADGENYTVIANGIVGDMDTPFNLEVNVGALQAAEMPGMVSLNVFHGSTDAPAVDVDARAVGTLIEGLAFGDFTADYLSVPADLYYLDVRVAGDPNIVATFAADVSGLAGGAATVFASGLLANTPSFGLFAALADGTVIELPATEIARLQVIHNSPSPTVDIYAGDDLLLDDFAYRTATPFIFVPAGVEVNLGVALENSMSSADALVNIPVTFENGETYVAIANGIVGNATTPFALEVNATAREASTVAGDVQLSVFHGSPDAPAVDVDARAVGTLIEGLAFGDFTADYLSVPADLYYLDVRAAGDPNIVATFAADVSGLAGGAATVFASGFLGDTPGFGLFAALADGNVIELPATEIARLQVIHNSPSPTVDIYAGDDLLLDDFAYRTATPFIFVPAGVEINLGVALDNSTSSADALVNIPVQFENGETYVAIANGIVGDMDTPFALEVNAAAREASTVAGDVQLSVFHGSPDAPAVDVDARAVGTLIEGLAFGDFTADYLSVPADLYYLDVRAAGDPNIVATFAADVSGLAGGAATVFASGFLGDTPGFGLFAALADGNVIELPATEIARLQVIHNSPSPTVDIYAGDDLLLDDFAFRTATPFIFVPAGVEINLGVALDNSTSSADALVNIPVQFENGETYVAIANGIVGDMDTPFALEVNAAAREASTVAGDVQLSVFHGSPDAPAVDVDARAVGTLIEGLAFGDFTADYLSVPADLYYLDVRAAGDPNIVATFAADVSTLGGGAATVFASGFLGDTPAFGLFAALADGTVIELPATEVARLQVIHNSPSPTVDIYAGDDLLLDDFAFRTATPFIFVPAGVEINLGVALDNSTSSADALVNIPVQFENGETYVAIANGIVGDMDTPFTLAVSDMAREAGTNPDAVQVMAFHGSPGAPNVNINDFLDVPFITDLAYNTFTNGYLDLEATDYALEVRPVGSPDLVGTFLADLNGLEGGAAVVVASGIVGGDPNFDLLAILPDGTVVTFTPVALGQLIHNSPSPLATVVDVWVNNAGILVDDFAFQTATAIGYFPTRTPLTIGVAGPDSEMPSDILVTIEEPLIFEDGQYHTIIANGIPLDATTPLELVVTTGGTLFSADPGQADINVFHGSPGAPAVDVTARELGVELIDGLAYGAFSGALGIDPATYYLEIRPDGSEDLVATFESEVTDDFAGFGITVLASGLLGQEPPFSLLAFDPLGNRAVFTPVAQVQVIHNSPTPTVDIYANGGLLLDDFAFRTATPFVDLPTRTDFDIAVAPDNSGSVQDSLVSFKNVRFDDGQKYIVMATGIVGNVDTPFGLAVNDMAQTAAESGSGVDLLLYHGATDAPEVDVVAEGVGVIFDDVEYNEYQGYLNVPAGTYVLNVTPSDNNDVIVRSYDADVSGLDGGAATVFASGLLGSEAPEDAFEVWVALPDGTTFPLSEIVNTEEVFTVVSSMKIAPNPARSFTQVNYTIEKATAVVELLYNSNGQLIRSNNLGQQAAGEYNKQLNLANLPAGLYTYTLQTEQGMISQRVLVQ